MMTVEKAKKLALNRSDETLKLLIDYYHKEDKVEVRRELVSSIGRQNNKDMIFKFLSDNMLKEPVTEVAIQMYRTILYNYTDERFKALGDSLEQEYNNEVMKKMKRYYLFRKKRGQVDLRSSDIKEAMLLEGDSQYTLREINEGSIHLAFTSPPYYNARDYSNYNSYKDYLEKMKKVFMEVNRVLIDGRFFLVNISPVIAKRPGREFESIRYPIHFDFHQLLMEAGFNFVDEIIWVKPEASVKNRIGGYQQNKKPLAYKPNTITESVLVYRKDCDFLLDKNIKAYNGEANNGEEIDTTNVWYISPKSTKDHPAVFPEKLCEKVLKYYSYKNDVVLDPFAGIGTFGKVAKTMNRIPVLCEMDEQYINIIKNKILIDDQELNDKEQKHIIKERLKPWIALA